MTQAPERSFARTTGLMLAGLLVWAAHFVFVYGFTGLACARPSWGWTRHGTDSAETGVAAATLAAALAILAVIRVARRTPDAFSRWLSISGALLAFVAVAWAGLAILLIPACPAP